MYYAYAHLKPDLTPFYIGKGRIDRARFLGRRNERHRRTVEKYGAANIIIEVMPCRSEAEALFRERLAIKALRASGVDLANITDGGDHASGYKWTKPSPKRGIPLTDAVKAKLSAKNKGQFVSQATREKMSAALKGAIRSPETRKKMADAMRARWADTSSRAVLVRRRQERAPYSEESRRKMSVSQRLRHERERATK